MPCSIVWVYGWVRAWSFLLCLVALFGAGVVVSAVPCNIMCVHVWVHGWSFLLCPVALCGCMGGCFCGRFCSSLWHSVAAYVSYLVVVSAVACSIFFCQWLRLGWSLCLFCLVCGVYVLLFAACAI